MRSAVCLMMTMCLAPLPLSCICFVALHATSYTLMRPLLLPQVPFDKPMQPAGGVEVWLGEVERRMRSSVRQQIIDSMAAYATQARPSWVRQWPAMVVLAVSQIYWSQEVENAIELGSLPQYLDK